LNSGSKTRSEEIQWRRAKILELIVANQNANKRYWDISQKSQDNKEKMQALEHYLDCHKQQWTVIYGGEDHMVRFGKSMPQQQYQYKEDEPVFTKVNLNSTIIMIEI
jgi:hypothetical protein